LIGVFIVRLKAPSGGLIGTGMRKNALDPQNRDAAAHAGRGE
jgi:hypothetical protein